MPLNHLTLEQEFQVPSAANAGVCGTQRRNVVDNYAKDEGSDKFRYRPHFFRSYRRRSSSLAKSGMTWARTRSILVTIGEHSHYLTARCIFC